MLALNGRHKLVNVSFQNFLSIKPLAHINTNVNNMQHIPHIKLKYALLLAAPRVSIIPILIFIHKLIVQCS